MNALLVIVAVLALFPAGLFLFNLVLYRRCPKPTGRAQPVSVLIPARNEETSIAAALESVLADPDPALEVLVLDDHSTDRTPEIVSAFARRDPRVRLCHAPPLPSGWCGKQHACHILGTLASHDWLVFMDADVRLEPGSILRMIRFMEARRASLGSGVPRQVTTSFSERLLIPLIHFVLLSFLPLIRMRRSTDPSYAAGCGQLFIARRADYEECGGHSAIRASLHDGLKLPAQFRKHGFKTDLFDATDLAWVRMYQTGEEVWRGLGKNATEGMGHPKLIGPFTVLLLGGQVAPWVLIPFVAMKGSLGWTVLACCATLVPMLVRIIAALRFKQPIGAALLHPVGIVGLLFIQWTALIRKLRGQPQTWRGRAYVPDAAGSGSQLPMAPSRQEVG